MAQVVVSIRIMPKGTEIDMSVLESSAKKEIIDFCNSKEFKTDVQPIAFGLNALNIIFVMDESKGSTEILEQKIAEIDGVESVEVTDVRRAVG
ncbi:elongation factor 1-beta [Candidatus Woesearchaeota archaeon]|nr:elongation factor 1-beta [Candidatus Woesearchaeota archaeon]